MQDEGKELLERQRLACEEKAKEESIRKTFGVVVSFIGEYKLDVEAEDFQSAAQMLEGANDAETREGIEEAIRLEIGKAEINDKLTIYHPDILSIRSDD